MTSVLRVGIVILCMGTYAVAGTTSIGTISAQGSIHVDGYAVNGNATLFDGSVVETGAAAATVRTGNLRMDQNVRITLAADSRGTLFRDRLVLQQGASESTLPAHFQIEANGLRVGAQLPDTRALVTLNHACRVEVAALSGSVEVTSARGLVLARVNPGHSVSFSMTAGTSTAAFTSRGMLSVENGHYYLTASDTNVKYEILGKNLAKFVGDKVLVSGTVTTTTAATGGAAYAVNASSVFINGGLIGLGGMSVGTEMIVGGVVVGSAATVATGAYFATTTPGSASI
jgi:hypothetical protein